MRLVRPNYDFKEEYLQMLDEWKSSAEEMVPFSLEYDVTDFAKFIDINAGFELKAQEGFVCHTTFWMINEQNQIVGTSNIRHKLNQSLMVENGHIGYGIRPSFRGKGHATWILALSLEKAKSFGVNKALLTCEKHNIASRKVIEKNGGVFRRSEKVKGKSILSFWIKIDERNQ